MTPSKKKSGINFESSLKKLEDIVRRLEDEQVPLDESLKLFAKGKELARLCETELQEAENRVRQLIDGEGGKVSEAPLDEASETEDSEDEDDSDSDAAETPNKPARTRDDLPF